MGFFKVGTTHIYRRKITTPLLGSEFGYGKVFKTNNASKYQINIQEPEHKGQLKMKFNNVESEFSSVSTTIPNDTSLTICVYIKNAQADDYLIYGNITCEEIIEPSQSYVDPCELHYQAKLARELPLQWTTKRSLLRNCLWQ